MNAEGGHENEHGRSWSLVAEANNDTPPCQTLPLMSERSRRNNQSRNSFYTGRRVPCVVFFFNVNNTFNFSSEQSSTSNSIFNSIMHNLLNFLQIQSSGTSPSPFELRPVAFMVSVGCSVAYYLASAAKFMFPGFASQFGVLVSMFGSLTVATLISLILHLPLWSILFVLLLTGGFFKLIDTLHGTYGNIRGRRPRRMQPHLPLYNVVFHR